MITRSKRIAIALATLGSILLVAGSVQAELPKKVSRAFKGKIVISVDALPAPDPEDPAGTIKAYRSQAVTSLQSEQVEGAAAWRFHFMAFMSKKPKTSSLSLDFYTDDKEKLFVAQKRMTGADPNLQLLSSNILISEEEGLKKGGKYQVRLTAQVGKKEVVLAKTKLTTK